MLCCLLCSCLTYNLDLLKAGQQLLNRFNLEKPELLFFLGTPMEVHGVV